MSLGTSPTERTGVFRPDRISEDVEAFGLDEDRRMIDKRYS